MKKIQATFIILLVGGMLVLSGCDAILEVFYPEFAYESGENVISIWIEFDMYGDQLSSGNPYFAGQLIETKSSNVVRQKAIDPFWHLIGEKNSTYWHLEGNLDFYGVEDGEYEVLVWLEQSGDDKPYGANEPYVYAANGGDAVTTFSFPSDRASDGWLYGNAISPRY